MIKFNIKGYEGNGYECERHTDTDDQHQHQPIHVPAQARCNDCSENAHCREGDKKIIYKSNLQSYKVFF